MLAWMPYFISGNLQVRPDLATSLSAVRTISREVQALLSSSDMQQVYIAFIVNPRVMGGQY